MINILKYLLFVEYLNPQELQKLNKLKDRFVDDIDISKINEFVSETMQKAINKLLKKKGIKKDELKVSIKIFSGIFNTKIINDTLDKICDKKLDKYEEIKHKNCASFTLEFNGKLRFKKDDEIIDFIDYQGDGFTDILIDDSFNLDLDSFGISTTPWALQNINKLTNIKYEEFLKLSDEIKEKISTVKQDNIVDFYKDLMKIINEFIPINGDKLRIELNLYTKDKQSEPFLNSFFIQDIYNILKFYENNGNDELLNKYFDTKNNENKFDLRDEQKLFSIFERYINNMSISAFPSTYALMFSQQFAVNEILKRFDKQKGEFYSVNGPPGTGKTTLLKDIIAGIITQRAIEIAKLNKNDIFSTSTENGIYCLNPNLKGYEIVVASSNNGAVENISKEIPEISSIDGKYLEKTDYFKEIATRVLSNNYDNENKGWGLISVALGSSSNISKFLFSALNKTNIVKNKVIDKMYLDEDAGKILGLIDYMASYCMDFENSKKSFNSSLIKQNNYYISATKEIKNAFNFIREQDNNEIYASGARMYISSFLNNETKKEKSSFFMSENGEKTELFEARVELFLKALDLHKAAILSNSEKFVKNLSELRKLFSKDYSSKLNSNDILNLWQTLFFIVPVISSTYASFSTCFRDIGQNELGILLSDESGQAAITNAIGALYRVKNAVVVGDPLQLEPVVTLTNDINNKLLELFGVENEFNVKTTSMQIRADKTEKYGTFIKQSGSKIWLGSPLRVHNRCDNPMFSVANKIAYDGMMIWGKDKNKDSLGLKSTWIDIQDEEWSGNCNLAEIRALRALLDELKNHHKDIGIISPFADNAKYIKAMVKDDYENISRGKVGTIHTMQGKEAKVIILILGGSSDGARVWAASKPNLLNVALTRAKEYIYIIGNKEKYSNLPYFETLASVEL